METLGKYKIISQLGRGAMGVVYKAMDPHIERTVALKTIRRDILEPTEAEEILSRFKREAQAAGRLTHPNIVTVYEYGEEGPTAYIAMEYVKGRSLKDILDGGERFKVRNVIKIMYQLLVALSYSHKHGVVHRDIKPGNIILLANGRIKVTDFGIARIESSNLTHFGDVMGTPSYMSPEQFMGHAVDNRSDIFAAGVIFYHLLTGEKPFPGNSMTTIMHRVLNETPITVSELNFQVPSALNALIEKAISKKPADRFQSAGEFAGQLKAVKLGANGNSVIARQKSANADLEATVCETAVGRAARPVTSDAAAGKICFFNKLAFIHNTKILITVLAGVSVVAALLIVLAFFINRSPEETIITTAKKHPAPARSTANRRGAAANAADQKIIEPVQKKVSKKPRGKSSASTNRKPNIKLVSKPLRQKNQPGISPGNLSAASPAPAATTSPLLKSSSIRQPVKKAPQQIKPSAAPRPHRTENNESNKYRLGGYGRMLDEKDW